MRHVKKKYKPVYIPYGVNSAQYILYYEPEEPRVGGRPPTSKKRYPTSLRNIPGDRGPSRIYHGQTPPIRRKDRWQRLES